MNISLSTYCRWMAIKFSFGFWFWLLRLFATIKACHIAIKLSRELNLAFRWSTLPTTVRLEALHHTIRADCLLIEAARAHIVNELPLEAHSAGHSTFQLYYIKYLYRALQVTCQRLEAWSSCGESHYGNAYLNLAIAALNLVKRPRLQTKSFLFSISAKLYINGVANVCHSTYVIHVSARVNSGTAYRPGIIPAWNRQDGGSCFALETMPWVEPK